MSNEAKVETDSVIDSSIIYWYRIFIIVLEVRVEE